MPANSLQLDFHDEFGPHKIIRVFEPKLDLYGALVVDNVAAGPSIGGLRMAQDVTVEECFRLARAMSLKNAAAGLAHGGGKSVLECDPRMPPAQKEDRIRAFACALASEEGYIFGPDMGTDEQCMAWIRDEIGRAVGLPREIGGIPLDELGATGFGLMHAIEAALPFIGLTLDGARMAVQGFGSVGMHAARFLGEKGAILVAASDSDGMIANAEGLDVAALIAHKRAGGSVGTFAGGRAGERDAVIAIECEIWIPAARPDVVTIDNVDQLQTRIVAQGANIPLTEAAEKRLHERGVLCLPDFIANAGGVICAAMEYHGVGETAAFAEIADRIAHNTAEMLTRGKADGTTPRRAALDMATARLRAAMATRRWSIF
ncbi:MAG: Glu/Leu/Phe/Val dehydrogenase dimerization domain-containing protein [Alphaproteobacteria bacterium]|jgi:glutamate dehydrogenase (NAD(P)+)|nr:Glu/Leu/Phe/Val dehydrogenase dimerization domain-containing protein [Alphaproteobacteria bacterium]